MNQRQTLMIPAFWLAALAATTVGCGDDPKEEAPAADATADASVADSTVGGDTATDGAGTGDSSAEDGAANKCGGEKVCLDDKDKPDLSLCPSPLDYTCEAGCCKKIIKCKVDADCIAKLGEDVCPDKRFLCGCGDGGQCQQRICGTDAQCPAGQLCNNGGCHEAPKAADLGVYLLRTFWIARPGDSVAPAVGFGAQARTADGQTSVDAAFKWQLGAKTTGFKLEGGDLVATDAAGSGTITATVDGAKAASNAAQIINLGPLPAGVNVRVTPLVPAGSGLAPWPKAKIVVVGQADLATPATPVSAETDASGSATFKDIKFPCDVHVVGDDSIEPISVLRLTGKDGKLEVVLPTRRYFHADLAYDSTGTMVAEAELVGGDVLRGEVDYSGEGEAGLGITSLGVGDDLLSFNIDALVGPSVKRPFNDKAPSLVNPEKGKPQDIPGGVSFLLSVPVVDGYVLAAPPGPRILWSLAGRVPLSDLGPAISQIVGAVDGGLDVGKVVSTLLPYLASFYSQVVLDVQFGEKLSDPGKKQNLAPDMPLGLSATIDPPGLPKVKDGVWADLILSVAGAMMPDGQFVPLGLTAAPDAVDGATPDGKVDGDPEEPGDQGMTITSAPLHSGLRVGKTPNQVLVHAAINVGGGGKKEGGSIIIGHVGELAATNKPGEFLGYSATSTYDPAKRALKVEPVAGAHLYRVIFNAEKSRRWVVVVPAEAAGKVLSVADIKPWGAATDAAKTPKRVFIGAFELRAAKTTNELLGPQGLTDLVRAVKRTSFIDVH